MLKFLYISDTHVMGITPESRSDNIKDTIKGKFVQVGKIANDNTVDFIIHGGDIFDTPDIANKLFNEISEIMRSWNKPIYVVPGNHDIYGYSMSTLPNTKLGVLASTGVVTILDRKHPLHYDNPNGVSISIEGQEYYADIDSGLNNDYAVYSGADVKILVAHSMLLDHDFFKNINHTKIDDVNTTADLILTGHYHPGYSFKEVNGTAFINLGSLLRRENTKENKNRIPQCLIVEVSDTGEFNFTPIDLNVEPYDKVFKDTSEAKSYDETISEFDNKIANHTFNGIDIVDMINNYAKENPEDTTLCNTILDSVTKAQIEKGKDNGFTSSPFLVNIEEVELTNFQGHEHLIVKFTKGLNIIEGSSGVGKSAILRGIYWCLYNTPSGSDFITTGKKNCSVKIKLSNKCIIERKRTKTSAGEYILTDEKGQVHSYKGFTNNVPIEISNAHQMPEIEINKNKYRLNIAEQLDGPFMISSTSNDKLAIIGALVDTDILDNLRAKFNAEKIKYRSDKKRYDENIKSKQQELSKYDNLDNIKSKVSKIETVLEQVDLIDESINNYKSVKNTYDSLLDNDRQLKYRLNNIIVPDTTDLNMLSSLVNEIEKYASLKMNYKKYNVIANNIINEEKYINLHTVDKKEITILESMVNEIAELDKLNSDYNTFINNKFEFDYDIDGSSLLITEYQSLINELEILFDLKNSYEGFIKENYDNELADLQEQIDKINLEKQKIIEDMKSEEAVCPYCNQKIDVDIALKECM